MSKIYAILSKFGEFMAAAGFAEEGEHEMAIQMIEEIDIVLA